MTNGSSQGLFVVISVVIFGIFVGISYLLFQDKMSVGLSQIFCDGFEQSNSMSNLGNGFCSETKKDEIKELPKYENSCSIDYTNEKNISEDMFHLKDVDFEKIEKENSWDNQKYKFKLRESNNLTGEKEAWGIVIKEDMDENVDIMENISKDDFIKSNDFRVNNYYNTHFKKHLEKIFISNNVNIERIFELEIKENLTDNEKKEFDALWKENKKYLDLLDTISNKFYSRLNREAVIYLNNKFDYLDINIKDFDTLLYSKYNKDREYSENEMKKNDKKGYTKTVHDDYIHYNVPKYRLFSIVDSEGNQSEKGTILIPETINDTEIYFETILHPFEHVFLSKDITNLSGYMLVSQYNGSTNIKSLYAPNFSLLTFSGNDNINKLYEFLENNCLKNIDIENGIS